MLFDAADRFFNLMEKLLERAGKLQSRLKDPILLEVKPLPEVILSKQCEEPRDDVFMLVRLNIYVSDELILIEQVSRISHVQLERVIRKIEL